MCMTQNEIIEFKYEELEVKLAIANGEHCEISDYMIAIFCGFACGFVDAFLVGKPNFREETKSKLGTLADKTADKITATIADELIKRDEKVLKKLQKKGLKGEELRKALEEKGIPGNFKRKGELEDKYPTMSEKITYLENKFRVSYDQSTNDKLYGDDVNITPDNHHLKSLAHSPDVIGLFFAILDQFTLQTSFVEGGKVIRVVPTKKGVELRGTNVISKLFCGFVNWMGHLLSDFCGSHSSKGRGDGIPIPFFELFEFCDFGSFVNGEGKNQETYTIATLAMEVYEQGYDARHGMAMAIPLLLNDLMIRFIWALKSHFCKERPWKESIPTNKHADLRVMLIYGNASLCVVDGIDAKVRSKGDLIEFCLRLNIVAWFTLIKRALKELELRCGFTYDDLKTQYEFLNMKLSEYLDNLKKIDYIKYEMLLSQTSELSEVLEGTDLEKMDDMTNEYFRMRNIDVQFESDDEFDDLMLDDEVNLKL